MVGIKNWRESEEQKKRESFWRASRGRQAGRQEEGSASERAPRPRSPARPTRRRRDAAPVAVCLSVCMPVCVLASSAPASIRQAAAASRSSVCLSLGLSVNLFGFFRPLLLLYRLLGYRRVYCLSVCLSVCLSHSQSPSLTSRRRDDRPTDGRTDGRTDRIERRNCSSERERASEKREVRGERRERGEERLG